eukprot:3116012-Rhodomonas_salina.3
MSGTDVAYSATPYRQYALCSLHHRAGTSLWPCPVLRCTSLRVWCLVLTYARLRACYAVSGTEMRGMLLPDRHRGRHVIAAAQTEQGDARCQPTRHPPTHLLSAYAPSAYSL